MVFPEDGRDALPVPGGCGGATRDCFCVDACRGRGRQAASQVSLGGGWKVEGIGYRVWGGGRRVRGRLQAMTMRHQGRWASVPDANLILGTCLPQTRTRTHTPAQLLTFPAPYFLPYVCSCLLCAFVHVCLLSCARVQEDTSPWSRPAASSPRRGSRERQDQLPHKRTLGNRTRPLPPPVRERNKVQIFDRLPRTGLPRGSKIHPCAEKYCWPANI